ncbi:hypothetical protein ABPG72_008976 [Tetrahymena utriculariae]
MSNQNRFENKVVNLEGYQLLKQRRQEDKQVDKISYVINQKNLKVWSYIKDEFQMQSLYQNIQVEFKEQTTIFEIVYECFQAYLENKIQISQLEIVIGDCCQVEIDELKIISNLLCRCVNLKVLKIEAKVNAFKCHHIQVLLNEIQLLSQLNTIYFNFSCNQLSDQSVIFICNQLKNMHLLTNLTLNISNNSISNYGIAQLARSLKSCENLQILSISIYKNLFDDQGISQIFLGISFCKRISSLCIKLFGSRIGLNSVQSFVALLQNNSNLRSLSLDLSFTEIENNLFLQISKSIKEFLRLDSIEMNISGIQIQGQIVNQFSDHLAQLLTLQSLRIYFYQNEAKIDKSCYQYFTQKIKQLQQITKLELDLSENVLDIDCIQNMFLNLNELPKISIFTLNLKNNQIGLQFLQQLNQSLKINCHLSNLNLQLIKQNLSDDCYREMFNLVKKFKALKKLSLTLNQNMLQQNQGLDNFKKSIKKLKYLVFYQIKV